MMTMEKYMTKNLSKVHDDIMKLNMKIRKHRCGPITTYYGICGGSESVRDSEKVVVASIAWNKWFHNIINPNEFKGGYNSTNVRSYMCMTHYNPYVEPDSSSVAHCTVLAGSSIDGGSSVVAQPGLSIFQLAVAQLMQPLTSSCQNPQLVTAKVLLHNKGN
ncbi:hypothetical protein V6N13_108931 [Hibiscus sabdariffa]